MPIYDYRCTDCDERFDQLVRRAEDVVSCPSCGSDHSERLLSVFAGMGGARSNAGSTPDYSRMARMPRGGGGCCGGMCGH